VTPAYLDAHWRPRYAFQQLPSATVSRRKALKPSKKRPFHLENPGKKPSEALGTAIAIMDGKAKNPKTLAS
jgi:hypothetical protein